MKKESNSHSNIVPLFPDGEKAREDVIEEDEITDYKNFFLPFLKRQAIRSAPSYRLFEILPKMTVDRLRVIYRAHLLRPAAGKLKKQELIGALLPVLMDDHKLEIFLKLLPEMEWEFFRNVLKKEELRDDQVNISGAQASMDEGYVCMFYYQEQFFFIVPDEVKEAFNKIDKLSLHQHREVGSRLNQMACAAVNLYGVLSLEELAEIINKQNKNKKKADIIPDIIELMLSGYDCYNIDYRISEGYIAEYDFTDMEDDRYLDMDRVWDLLYSREGKPRYLPDLQSFLAYADPDYYDQTPHTKALREEIQAMGLSREKAEELMDELHFHIAQEEGMSEVIPMLEKFGVSLESKNADKIIQLISNVFNSTRLWKNYGHTPHEIVKIMGMQKPRAIHFGPGFEKMLLNDEMDVDELERSVMDRPILNDEFDKSFMSEIARIKSLKAASGLQASQNETVTSKKPGRNEPCPCGSGLKYKKCCGKTGDQPD